MSATLRDPHRTKYVRKILAVCCNLRSETYNLQFFTGVLAQLVERLNGIEEVTGSNPVGSISFLHIAVAAPALQLCANQPTTMRLAR